MRKIVYIFLLSAMAVFSRELQLPVPPADMRVPSERAAFIMEHFWDSLPLDDSASLRDSIFMERNLVEYFSLAPHASESDVAKAVRALVARLAADDEALGLFWHISEKYLSEPQSPVRCESAYYAVASALRDIYAPGSSQRDYIDYRIGLMEKNRPGSRAADFEFIDRQGLSHRFLASLRPGVETLLVFFDPDCEDCHELAARLQSGGTEGRDVVMITPHEVDMSLWQVYASTLPEDWTVGYSPSGEIDVDEIYYVPEFPTVCVIGDGGVVISRPF